MEVAELHDKFIKGLSKYGLSAGDVATWNYCGGDWDYHHEYFQYIFPQPPDKTCFINNPGECICGHATVHNCYITDRKKEKILIVGSCCANQFVEKRLRLCRCGELHRNTWTERCNRCRAGVCDICGDECNSSFSTCFKCNKRYSFQERKNIEEYQRTRGTKLIHECTDLQSSLYIKHKYKVKCGIEDLIKWMKDGIEKKRKRRDDKVKRREKDERYCSFFFNFYCSFFNFNSFFYCFFFNLFFLFNFYYSFINLLPLYHHVHT